MDLLKRQKELQEEGWRLIKELNLEELLSQYGELDIGGSIKTGLMAWRDIDIGVINDKLPDEDLVWKVAREIAEKQHVTKVTVQDNASDGKYYDKYPKGFYLGVKYDHDDIGWKLDIWFAKEDQAREPYGNYDEWLKTQINDENKLIILDIKHKMHLHPLYRRKFSSVDIYDAVLKNDVKDVEGLKSYLKTTKNLDLD